MRAAVALALLLALSTHALAEPSPPSQPRPETLRVRRRHARVERAVGLGLAGLALAVGAVGGILLGASGPAMYDQGARYQIAAEAAVGLHLLLGVPGVTLAIDGQARLADTEWRLRLLLGGFVVPSRGGAIAGLGFRF